MKQSEAKLKFVAK